ncbi:hypothetical protein ACQ856_18190 [Mycolicibacterium psychrotolerans]|uniref:hypothetical protein n=1 Tax=Mycolicibacterium psychrotolerans TaxID=216929 RepID=UPI003D667F5E
MSNKPQTVDHHDSSAPNCERHDAAVHAGGPARPERTCQRCRFANRRKAVRP